VVPGVPGSESCSVRRGPSESYVALFDHGGFVTVSVTALFFASYRDLVGSPSLSIELAEGATVADLVSKLRERGAPFDALPAQPAVAVNRAYALLDEPLSADDEVAFIPPVAGG